MKKRRLLSLFTAVVVMVGSLTSGFLYEPPIVYAATATALVTQINNIGGGSLTAVPSVLDPNVIEVTGTESGVTSTVTLNIDPNVTINWGADLSGNTASGKYLLNLSGGGTFNLIDDAEISNSSGIITVTGDGAKVNIDSGTLSTPTTGNGISINIAAKNVTVNVNAGGSISNKGTNSAINVTAGAAGVRINVSGSVVSKPAGYAINDGGTTLCTNDTLISVNGGEVTAGSACAIKSTGADSVVMIMGGVVSNAATVNSNPVIYMNGGLGDNIIVGGTGTVKAAENNLGYGIQTTGNVLIMDKAEVIAAAGRAVNLVGMDSTATVNGGLVTATTGVAICTATTNPASVENARIIINGGVVSTDDPTEDDKTSVDHGSSRTIYATGAKNEVVINGGWVYTTWDKTEAVYVSGSSSRAIVNGGWVTARDHFAIEAYNGGYIYINSGFVFAYGDEPIIYKTGANYKKSAIGAISEDRIILNDPGNGVVVTWDRDSWIANPGWHEDDYTEGKADHLTAEPNGLISGIAPFGIMGSLALFGFSEGDSNQDVAEDDGADDFTEDIDLSGLPEGEDVDLSTPAEDESGNPPDFTEEDDQPGMVDPFEEDDQSALFVGASLFEISPFAESSPNQVYWHSNGGRPDDGIYYNNSGNVGFFPLGDAQGVLYTGVQVELPVPPKYELTVTHGSGAGMYQEGVMVGITADSPPAGKVFDCWSGVSLADPYSETTSFVMPGYDVIVTAIYKDKLYTLTVNDGTGGGSYPAGSPVTITANTPPSGKEFDKWTGAVGGLFADLSSSATVFQMPAADVTITAEYMDIPLFSFSLAGGSIVSSSVPQVGGKYPAGTVITINGFSSFPSGYSFSGWLVKKGGGLFDGDDALSQYNAKFIMPAADSAVEMNQPFSTHSDSHTLIVVNGENRSISPSPYTAGVDVAIEAHDALEGKVFAGWTIVSGKGMFANADAMVTTFRMSDADTVVRANYKDVEYDLFVEYGVINDGLYAGGITGSYVTGEVVSLLAEKPAETDLVHYEFAEWTVSGGGTIDDPTEIETIFTMPDNPVVITAHWTPLYRLVVLNGGIVNSNLYSYVDYVEAGEDVEINAAIAAWPGYNFGGWQSRSGGSFNDATIDSGAIFTMPDNDALVVADFVYVGETSKKYKLTVIDGSGSGDYEAGIRVTITAPLLLGGLVFTGWTSYSNEGSLNPDSSYAESPNFNYGVFEDASAASTSFVMPDQDVTVTANYAETYELEVDSGDGSGFKPAGDHTAGERITITAEDRTSEDKAFTGWTADDGSFVNAGMMETTFIMPAANAQVVATYTDIELHFYALTTVDCISNDPGPFEEGAHDSVTITANIPTGKTFDHWDFIGYSGSVSSVGPNSIKFDMPDNNVTVTAVFVNEGYKLTIVTASGMEEERYLAGTVVLINALPARGGQAFSRWEADKGEIFTDGNAAVAFFIMPDEDATVTAIYRTIDSTPLPYVDPYNPHTSASVGGTTPSPGDESQAPDTLEHTAFVRGIGNDLFAPDKDMSRAETVQMFYNLLLDKNIGTAGIFPDIPEQAWYKEAAEKLAVLGVVVGRPDGLFYPQDSITRAEFVAIAVKFMGEKPEVAQAAPFTDVSEAHWAYSYINKAAGYGWIQGVGDGRFDPNRHISRAEAVTMTNRMFLRVPDKNYIDNDPDLIFYSDVPKQYWAFYDITEASNDHDYTRDENGGEIWKGN